MFFYFFLFKLEPNCNKFGSLFVTTIKVMKLTKKSLLKLVTNLFEGALDDTKDSVLDVDIRYFEGKSNAYEQIMLLMQGDENELFETLEQLSYRGFAPIEDESPF